MFIGRTNSRAPASLRLSSRFGLIAVDADSFVDAFTALTTACEQATRSLA